MCGCRDFKTPVPEQTDAEDDDVTIDEAPEETPAPVA